MFKSRWSRGCVFPCHLLPKQTNTNQKQGICLFYNSNTIGLNFLFLLSDGKRNLNTPLSSSGSACQSALCSMPLVWRQDHTYTHVIHLNPAERVTSETEIIFKPTGKWTGCLTRRRNTQIKPLAYTQNSERQIRHAQTYPDKIELFKLHRLPLATSM